ncbi:MAG: complement resistance protein TraT [Gammaproteobacteria bacterium]|nr:MAG: complement resistance protein TraT [Gammaproteobacteria bacterium]
MNNFKKIISLFTIVTIVALSGCSAMHTAIKKRNLDVQTKMSATIFLDPVAASKRTVFLQLRNTSDKQSMNFLSPITAAILAKGYQVVDDPDAAHYWIQANVLKVGKSDLRETQQMLTQGYGGALAGAVVGAQFGSGKGALGMGMLGAAAGLIGDALVDDVMFVMITDIQLSEKAKVGVIVTEANNAKLQQGTSGYKNVTSTEQVDRKKYQTRIVSTANKVNLKFEEAQPVLLKGLLNSISGLL